MQNYGGDDWLPGWEEVKTVATENKSEYYLANGSSFIWIFCFKKFSNRSMKVTFLTKVLLSEKIKAKIQVGISWDEVLK